MCGFIILPSCAESQYTSVLTAMFAGLIPICTIETGIDLDKSGGNVLSSIQVDDIRKIIRCASTMDKAEYLYREQKSYQYAINNHTIKQYKEMFSEAIDSVLVNTCADYKLVDS